MLHVIKCQKYVNRTCKRAEEVHTKEKMITKVLSTW